MYLNRELIKRHPRSIEFMGEVLDKLVLENRLEEIPGVGEAIAKNCPSLSQPAGWDTTKS
jgi:hypothetical protein